MNHTPTPWRAIPLGTHDEYGPTFDIDAPPLIGPIAEAITAEDAAFIVRAVNAHEALVAALKRARDHVIMQGIKQTDQPEALAEIKAALALAEKQTAPESL